MKKKTQRPPKIIRRTEQEKQITHHTFQFISLPSSGRLRRESHSEKINVSDIFLWSTSRMSSHKYTFSFLSSLSELLVVSKGLFTWYRMTFIPEWVSFQREVRTVFTKIEWHSPKAFSIEWRFRARSDTNAPLALDYTICDFQSGTKFVFSLHDTRIKFRRRTRISFAMETGMTSLQNDLYGNEMSFQYRVI